MLRILLAFIVSEVYMQRHGYHCRSTRLSTIFIGFAGKDFGGFAATSGMAGECTGEG
jgi:glutamate synthase domain-containing protein 3